VNPVGRSSGLSEPGYNPCASRETRFVNKPDKHGVDCVDCA